MGLSGRCGFFARGFSSIPREDRLGFPKLSELSVAFVILVLSFIHPHPFHVSSYLFNTWVSHQKFNGMAGYQQLDGKSKSTGAYLICIFGYNLYISITYIIGHLDGDMDELDKAPG